jgi:hypothetical protein
LNEPDVRWTLDTQRTMLRGNNVQVTNNGRHVFATSSDGALLILSNLLVEEAAAAAADTADTAAADTDTNTAALLLRSEPTLQVFEPPRNDFEASIYCNSGVVLVSLLDNGDGQEDAVTVGEAKAEGSLQQQFAVYGVTVTQELNNANDGTAFLQQQSYIYAVDTNGNLILSSDALEGAISGTPVVLGHQYLYVLHNVDDSLGRISILNLNDNLALVETIRAEESLTEQDELAEELQSRGGQLGPFAPAAGREIPIVSTTANDDDDDGTKNDIWHVLVFGESTQDGTSPFGNLYMLVHNPANNSFQLKIVSTVPGATLHAPALFFASSSSSSSSSLSSLDPVTLQAFLGSYAAGVNAWTGNADSNNNNNNNNIRGGEGEADAGGGGGDLSSVLLLDEATASESSSSSLSSSSSTYVDIFPSWMQRVAGDFFNPNAPLPVTPVLSNDASLLFVAGASNSIMALDTLQGGTTAWTLETDGVHTATPLVSSSSSLASDENDEWSSSLANEVVYFIERDNGIVRQLDAQQVRVFIAFG